MLTKTGRDWEVIYKEKGAFWLHDGNPKRPHALLTNGGHSNGFFNSQIVIENPILMELAAADLFSGLVVAKFGYHVLNRVVGPAMGGIILAHDIARVMSKVISHPPQLYLSSYTEKTPSGDEMVFSKTRVISGETVLICEDVFTTGGSVELTAKAVIRAGAVAVPFVVVLVNRSGLDEVNGRRIISLINRHMPNWMPEECPLCKKGSEAIRPKNIRNWERLNSNYPS